VERSADVEGVGLAEGAVDFEIGFGDGLGFGSAVGEFEEIEELEDLVSTAAAFAVDGGLLFLPCFFFGAAWDGPCLWIGEEHVAAGGESETADDAVGFGEFDAAALDDDASAEVADGDPFAGRVFRVDGHADVGVVEGDGAEEVAFVDEFGDIAVAADLSRYVVVPVRGNTIAKPRAASLFEVEIPAQRTRMTIRLSGTENPAERQKDVNFDFETLVERYGIDPLENLDEWVPRGAAAGEKKP
jgi:hypothetical protein